MRVMLGIPYWGDDPERQRNFLWVRDYMTQMYPFDGVYVSGLTETRGGARNAIMRWALYEHYNVVVMCDADTVCSQKSLVEAIDAAFETGKLAFPHDKFRGLSEQGTKFFFEGDDRAFERLRMHADYPALGGVLVMRPAAYFLVGGMPELEGWGFEDVIFAVKARTRLQTNLHFEGYATHLYHRTDCCVGGDDYLRNLAVCKEYEEADGNLAEVLRLDRKYLDQYYSFRR